MDAVEQCPEQTMPQIMENLIASAKWSPLARDKTLQSQRTFHHLLKSLGSRPQQRLKWGSSDHFVSIKHPEIRWSTCKLQQCTYSLLYIFVHRSIARLLEMRMNHHCSLKTGVATFWDVKFCDQSTSWTEHPCTNFSYQLASWEWVSIFHYFINVWIPKWIVFTCLSPTWLTTCR
jgi:hypothetical protein